MTDTGFPTLQVELDAAMKLINDEWVQLAGQIEKADALIEAAENKIKHHGVDEQQLGELSLDVRTALRHRTTHECTDRPTN